METSVDVVVARREDRRDVAVDAKKLADVRAREVARNFTERRRVSTLYLTLHGNGDGVRGNGVAEVLPVLARLADVVVVQTSVKVWRRYLGGAERVRGFAVHGVELVNAGLLDPLVAPREL